jgi:transcriptional regulator with XRE-family HTH domain
MPAKITLPPDLAEQRRRTGGRIRALRTERGWTQEQLAERAGVDRQTIYRMELSSRGLSIDAYLVVAAALGIPAWRLFRDE